MSLKIKLISCISLLVMMLGLLIVGVFASTRTINLKGSVEFNISDTTLYVKDIRVQTDEGNVETIPNFMPGYTNTAFDLNLGTVTSSSGIVTVYFDFINTTSTTYSATASGGSGVVLSISGTIEGSEVPITDVPAYEGISGTITLTIQLASGTSGNISLDGMSVTLEELYIQEGSVLYVNNVTTKTDTSEDTIAELNGGRLINDSIDLSGIEFATGETTLTISMTSLSAKYIKNKVSWVNTSDVTISSTSLYLPQNSGGQLTGGESRDLKITVNNTGSTTTISGLEVEFEEKEDLLQVTEEGETSTYTEEGYWYVEMGTYSTTTDNAEGKRESEYLRWRYFSDTTSHYEFDRNTRPTGDGYFILESYYSSYNNTDVGGLYCSWNNDYTYRSDTDATHNYNGWDNIDANDYSTSTIRQYINGNNVYKSSTCPSSWIYKPDEESTYSNMYTDLHIDPENDIVYIQIIGRALSDLYTNMGWDGNSSSPTFNNVDFPDLTNADPGYQYEKTDIDKFWLLSDYEAYNLLSYQDEMNTPSTDREWGDVYWLRSPCSPTGDLASFVDTSGYFFNALSVDIYYYAARAAFKFSI